MRAVRDAPGGAVIEVHVRPRSRPALAVAGGHVVVSVAAPPVQGRANDEARRALAAAVGVAPSDVRLVAGTRARTKKFLVSGLDGHQLEARLHGVSRSAG